jgi:hypothetical protein
MTKHAEGLTAAVYARISEDRDGTGLGVARQEKDCIALASRRGWHVARVYVDNDISAYSGKPRPQYRQMLDDIKAGHVRARPESSPAARSISVARLIHVELDVQLASLAPSGPG